MYVPVSDAPAQGLVDGPIGLDLVPVATREQTSIPAVLVVILPLQLNLETRKERGERRRREKEEREQRKEEREGRKRRHTEIYRWN